MSITTEKEKDYEYKIELLKRALISERSRVTGLKDEITCLKKELKEFEEILAEKDCEVIQEIKEKNDLIDEINGRKCSNAQLIFDDQESSGSYKTSKNEEKNDNLLSFSSATRNVTRNSVVSRNSINSQELQHQLLVNGIDITKLSSDDVFIINTLKLQNESLQKLLSDSNANIRKVKEDFQNIITIQSERIKSLEAQIAKAASENNNCTMSVTNIINQNKSFEIKLMNLTNDYKKCKEELNMANDALMSMQEVIQDKDSFNTTMAEKIKRLENENVSLAVKLAELKNAILDENIKEKMYRGYKKDMILNTAVTIIFTMNNEGFYIIVIREEGSKSEEVIKIDDVESIKLVSESESTIEVRYAKNKKLKCSLFNITDNVHQIIKSFRDFRDKSLKLHANYKDS